MKKLAAGNWKMNGTRASLAEVAALLAAHPAPVCEMLLCPPATLIAQMAVAAKGSALRVGAQDCHAKPQGAHTGDISVAMLKDAGATHVILGHSERRAGYGETDALVAAKVEAALRAGLEPIICVGETLDERKAGKALEIVTGQVRGSLPATLAGKTFSVAYEPVWAIGTGLTPTTPEIEEVHIAIRATLVEVFGDHGKTPPILYGGSVKPSNANEILHAAEVGGALVGGASLKAEDFLGIIKAL